MPTNEMPVWMKIAIEHLAEALERAISRADPGSLNRLSPYVAGVVNWLLLHVPRNALAIALNYLGEVVGRKLAARHPVAGVAIEEVSERIGIGLRNLAERMQSDPNFQPTHEQIHEVVAQAGVEAHAAIPNMRPLPGASSIWLTWPTSKIDALLGLQAALREEIEGDETWSRRMNERDGHGLEGLAFRTKCGLSNLLEHEPDVVLYHLAAPGGRDEFDWSLKKPWTEQRRLIEICQSYATGPKGWWAWVRDELDAQFDRTHVRNALKVFALGGSWITFKLGLRAFKLALKLALVWPVYNLALAMVYLIGVSAWARGMGFFVDDPGPFSGLRLLWGGWTFPPEPMQGSWLLSGILWFTIFKALFTPQSVWGSAVSKIYNWVNPFCTASIFAPAMRLLEDHIGHPLMHPPGPQRDAEGNPELPFFRRIGILLMIIPLAVTVILALPNAFGLAGWVFNVMLMCGVGFFLSLELISHSPWHFDATYRREAVRSTVKWIQRGALIVAGAVFFVGLADKLIIQPIDKHVVEPAQGFARAAWHYAAREYDLPPELSPDTYDRYAKGQSSASSSSSTPSSSLPPRQQATCDHFRKFGRTPPSYCE